MSRPPPPFTLDSALQKVRLAHDAWNARDPARVAPACSPDSSGPWFRRHGNENGAYDAKGRMHTRIARIDDLPHAEAERRYHGPAGRRPDGQAGLTELGL